MQPDSPASGAELEPSRFLFFRIADELYGTPLSHVREIVKLGPIKPVPYTVSHFKGVINLRGKIVSVIDLRVKFGLPVSDDSDGLVLLVETEEGLLGTIIDGLEAVEALNERDIERNPAIETRIPRKFFLGIAKRKSGLTNLIDIVGCLSSDDLRVLRQIKETA